MAELISASTFCDTFCTPYVFLFSLWSLWTCIFYSQLAEVDKLLGDTVHTLAVEDIVLADIVVEDIVLEDIVAVGTVQEDIAMAGIAAEGTIQVDIALVVVVDKLLVDTIVEDKLQVAMEEDMHQAVEVDRLLEDKLRATEVDTILVDIDLVVASIQEEVQEASILEEVQVASILEVVQVASIQEEVQVASIQEVVPMVASETYVTSLAPFAEVYPLPVVIFPDSSSSAVVPEWVFYPPYSLLVV